MKIILPFSTLFILIFFNSCAPNKITPSGQLFKEYYSFSKDSSSRLLALLDTNHVYITERELVKTYLDGKSKVAMAFSKNRTEKGYYYSYLKFSSNGIAYLSDHQLEPFNEKNIYFAGGQYCYYKIVGDEIRLELFDWNLRKFTIMYMNVLPESILFYKDKLRVFWGAKGKHNIIYKKSEIVYSKPLIWPN